MTPNVVLDLFCGEGGAARGYASAGFTVAGVDIEPQPRYPFEFVQADAMAVLGRLAGGLPAWPGAPEFHAVHASPPCQGYARLSAGLVIRQYPRLIEPARELLVRAGIPWVIENVPGAPLPEQDTLDGAYGVLLCGTMFGLRIRRHRLFETSFPVASPRRGCDHSAPVMNPYWAAWRRQQPEVNTWAAWRREMGVDWMSQRGGQEAIPPVFTEHIGAALLAGVTG